MAVRFYSLLILLMKMKSTFVITAVLGMFLLTACAGNDQDDVTGVVTPNNTVNIMETPVLTQTSQVGNGGTQYNGTDYFGEDGGQITSEPNSNGPGITQQPGVVIAPPVLPVAKSKYQSDAFKFKFEYPSNFIFGTKDDVETIVSLKFPDSYSKGTNLVYAKIDFKSFPALKEGSCAQNMGGTMVGAPVTFNGVQFTKRTWSEGAAGHVGDQVGYFTSYNKKCYQAILTMYSSNISNYPSYKAPKPFNADVIKNVFTQIMETFAFIK